MKDPLHNIDDLFYDSIEGHSEYPAGNVWNKIETQLDKDIATVYKRKYKTIKRYAFILLILLMGFIVYEATIFTLKKEPGLTTINAEEQTTDITYDDKLSVQNIKDKTAARADKDLAGYYSTKIDVSDIRTVNIPLFSAGNIQIVSTPRDAKIISGIADGQGVTNNFLENKTTDRRDLLSIPVLALKGAPTDNVAINPSPVIFTPSASPINVIPDKQSTSGIKRSGFSFSATFSPGIVWNSINDDRRHRHRWGSGNRGGNGGGNNGGGNGGGVGGIGGGNNGANVGSAGNAGNNSGSNGGGGRGNNRHDIKQGESGHMAYSGGIKLSYDLGNRLSLATGLNYLSATTSVTPRKLYAEKDQNGEVSYRLICSSGYSYLQPESGPSPRAGDSVLISDTRNTVSYMGVPLMAEYTILSTGRLSLKGTAGGQVNLLLKASTKSVMGKGTPAEAAVSANTEGLKPAYLSIITGLAAEMRLTRDVSITLAPVAQFGLTNVNNRTSVKTRPHYFGLATGFTIKL